MAGTTGKALLIVTTDPSPEWEDELNRWYDEEHIIDELQRVPGVLSARRYIRAPSVRDTVFGDQAKPAVFPHYLAIFELETEEVLHRPEYQAFMNNPTEWGQRVIPNVPLSVLVYRQVYPERGVATRDAPKG